MALPIPGTVLSARASRGYMGSPGGSKAEKERKRSQDVAGPGNPVISATSGPA